MLVGEMRLLDHRQMAFVLAAIADDRVLGFVLVAETPIATGQCREGQVIGPLCTYFGFCYRTGTPSTGKKKSSIIGSKPA